MISSRNSNQPIQHNKLHQLFVILFYLFLFFLSASLVEAKKITLAWDPNPPEDNVIGYKIYYGNTSQDYEFMIYVQGSTLKKVKRLKKGLLYYFAVTAYNTEGTESAYSEELMVNTCTFTLSRRQKSFGPEGGIGHVNITTQPECQWSAISAAPWVSILEGESGTGNGTITYAVEANPDPEKRIVGSTFCGKSFTVTQKGTSIP